MKINISHSQAELKRWIKEKDEELKNIIYSYRRSDVYKKNVEDIAELRKKITLLEREQAEMAVDHKEEYKDEIQIIKDDRDHFRDLLNQLQRGLIPSEYSEELQKMFSTFDSGSDGAYHKRLEWVSDDGKYALFKRKSFSSYGGRMSGSGSVGAVWALVKVVENYDRQELSYFSPHIGDRNKNFLIWATEGGRWNKERQQEMEEALFKHINGIEE